MAPSSDSLSDDDGGPPALFEIFCFCFVAVVVAVEVDVAVDNMVLLIFFRFLVFDQSFSRP